MLFSATNLVGARREKRFIVLALARSNDRRNFSSIVCARLLDDLRKTTSGNTIEVKGP